MRVSELCRREGISPTQYYNWRNQLLHAADRVFDEKSTKKPSREQERLATELTRAKDVIAEITAENLELKKTRWG